MDGFMVEARVDQDSPWKSILREYFREAIEFFFPAVARVIDWSRPVEFLDKEFQQITPDAEIGRRFADQLVKVHRRRGKPLILLIHLEVQAAPEKDFPERMFTYAIRIFEYFRQMPVSLALLCDGRQNWRPHQYVFRSPGSWLQFEFTAVKLLDYRVLWGQLEQSRNPFAVVVMAHLKMQETQGDWVERKAWKFTLVKRLYELGYDRADVIHLFRFIDWVMILPEALKRAFWDELKVYEEERRMPYVTSVEQIGYERGRGEGREEGQGLMLLALLEEKLGPLPQSLLERLRGLSWAQLLSLKKPLFNFESIADLESWLDNQN
jgi:Domain of unknown function (DUF4351)